MSTSLELHTVYFFHGLAFVLWAAAVFWLRPRPEDRAAWFWLALAALCAGAGQWLDMLAPSFGHAAVFAAIHAAAVTLPLVFLTEFARRGLRADGPASPRDATAWLASRWVYVPLGILALSGGLAGDWAALEATCRYVFGLSGILPAAWVLTRCARRAAAEERIGFWIAAAAIALYVIPTALVVGRADLGPASIVHGEAFRSAVGLPVDLVRAACALAAAAGLWMVRCARVESKARPGRFVRWGAPAACAAFVAMGWAMTPWDYAHAEVQVVQSDAGGGATTSPQAASAPAAQAKSNGLAAKGVSLSRQRSGASTIVLVLLVQGVIAGLCLLAYRFSR